MSEQDTEPRCQSVCADREGTPVQCIRPIGHHPPHVNTNRGIHWEDEAATATPGAKPGARDPLERIADALSLLAVHSERRIFRDFDAKRRTDEHPLASTLGELEGLLLLRLSQDTQAMPSPADLVAHMVDALGQKPTGDKS